MIPGEVLVIPEDIEINADRATLEVHVENTGDRPIQIGSHYHFSRRIRVCDSIGTRRAAIGWTLPRARRCASSRDKGAPCAWFAMPDWAVSSAFKAKSWGSSEWP